MSAHDIVDSHHHLWDTHALDYELFETIEPLRRPFTCTDYESVAATTDVSRSICVEAASAGADGRRETEWLLAETAASSRIAAVIAWAPLDHPNIDAYLDWLTSHDGKPIVGIRRSFEFEPPDFAQQTAVINGARAAGARGLVVDLVLFAPALPAASALADACPETQFVLDHLGKPPVRDGRYQPWADHLAELALRPNVVCKLSGLPTEARHDAWTTADLAPYAEHALDCFGHDRLLFGSDWPVVELAGGMRRWLLAVHELLAPLSEDEHTAILGQNARRIYRI